MLKLDGLSSGYNGAEVLHSISLEISKPAIYVVLGPNGAGKTTLFRTVAGVLRPISGKVSLDGQDLYAANQVRREIGYLSHLTAMPEEMTVAKALAFYGAIEEGDTDKALERLDLRDLASKKVSDLSQGQKKRVSIAKLFLRERKLYLMDEPTSNLDPVVAKEVRDILLNLSKDRFVLYSSHNLYEAQEIGDFIVLIKDGKLGFYGRKEELRTGGYRVGLRASGDLAVLFPEGKREKEYFVLDVAGPQEVGAIVKRVVDAGMTVYEVKELGNPLEDLFGGGR
ncbi:MAG: heme ABC exporter ATP-binding protein CcmA [Nitrososphaerales archaeon]|nr:heme ABC exporter ATP-binding protein CcmA [Nitrososphaerales archaeon]